MGLEISWNYKGDGLMLNESNEDWSTQHKETLQGFVVDTWSQSHESAWWKWSVERVRVDLDSYNFLKNPSVVRLKTQRILEQKEKKLLMKVKRAKTPIWILEKKIRDRSLSWFAVPSTAQIVQHLLFPT